MLELINISKRYKDKWVLKDIHMKLNEERCVGILGVNGSGKTTLLSILAGVLKPNSGKVMYSDVDLLKNQTLRRKLIAYIPQKSPLIEELNALDNLKLWYDKEELKKEISSGVISLLGVDEFLKKPVSALSMGMKKRLSIACAVASKPKILLMDEPSAYLDIICKADIHRYISEHKRQGGSIILVSHDVGDFGICDEHYVLKAGILNPFEYKDNVDELIKIIV